LTSTERLETLLREFPGVLRSALARRVRGRPGLDLDDLEQEARIRLWKALEGEKTIEHPPSYINRVAATVLIDALRHAQVRGKSVPLDQVGEQFASTSDLANPLRRAESRELIRQIDEALGAMGADSADALRLYLQGLNTTQVAALLNWTEPRTRNLIYRGMERLRGELRGMGVSVGWE